MGSSNTEQQMTVPSYWEIGRLEKKLHINQIERPP